MPSFSVLRFASQVLCFLQIEGESLRQQKIRACFITRHTLLQWSEKEPTISLRYACIWIESWQGMFNILIAVGLHEKGRLISGASLLVFLRYASITRVYYQAVKWIIYMGSLHCPLMSSENGIEAFGERWICWYIILRRPVRLFVTSKNGVIPYQNSEGKTGAALEKTSHVLLD